MNLRIEKQNQINCLRKIKTLYGKLTKIMVTFAKVFGNWPIFHGKMKKIEEELSSCEICNHRVKAA